MVGGEDAAGDHRLEALRLYSLPGDVPAVLYACPSVRWRRGSSRWSCRGTYHRSGRGVPAFSTSRGDRLSAGRPHRGRARVLEPLHRAQRHRLDHQYGKGDGAEYLIRRHFRLRGSHPIRRDNNTTGSISSTNDVVGLHHLQVLSQQDGPRQALEAGLVTAQPTPGPREL